MNENLTNNVDNIVCSNCGTSNASNTSFCIKCGTSLQTQQINENQNINVGTDDVLEPINNDINDSGINQDKIQQSMPQQNYNTMSDNIIQQKTNGDNLNYFSYILGALIKPYDKFKSEEQKLSDIKNVSILSLIVVVALTIIRLITTMISAVRVKSFWSDEISWTWENLKEVQYFKVLGQGFLIYAGILLSVALVYFLSNLVIKKDTNFVKILGGTVTAFIPFAVCSSVLYPLLSIVYIRLGICVAVIGFIYALMILLELMNDLINIENKNVRIYFHLICLSIIFIGGGLIAYKLIMSSLTSSLGSFGSLFS